MKGAGYLVVPNTLHFKSINPFNQKIAYDKIKTKQPSNSRRQTRIEDQ